MLDGEQEIIKKAVRGVSSAFASLYDYYQPMIYRFVVIKVGRREDAEDITHQVFMSAWQNVRKYKYQGYPFSSWLYQIARNQIIDHYRAKKEETSLDRIDPEYFVLPAAVHFDLASKMDFEKVRFSITMLKPEYQDIVIMRFVEDLPLREVAAAVGKTEGAVKLMQHRAMKELKRLVGDQDK